jgi:hypothetical protein
MPKPRNEETGKLTVTTIDLPKSIMSRDPEQTALTSQSVSDWSLNDSLDALFSHMSALTASSHPSGEFSATVTCDSDVTACCKHVDRRPRPELVQRACRIWTEASGDALEWNIYIANGFHDLIDKGQKFKSFMPLTQDRLVCGQYLRAFRSCLHYYTHNQCEMAIASAERLAPYKIYKLEVGHEMETLENAYAKTRHLDRFFEQDPLRICQGKIGSCVNSAVPGITEEQLAMANWIYERLTGRAELDWDTYSLNQEYWRKLAFIIADRDSGCDPIVFTWSQLETCQKYFSAFRVYNLEVHGQGNCPAVRRRIDVRHVDHDSVNGTRLDHFHSTFDTVKALLRDLNVDHNGDGPNVVASEFARHFVEIPDGPPAGSLERYA